MDRHDIKHFPDISSKLNAQPKKSAFERSKAEAEAKRLREEAETAAVYEDFVKSFEDEPKRDASPASRSHPAPFQPSHPPRPGNGPPKRHFGSSSLRNSGPGSLGPVPSSLGPKRPLDQHSGPPKRKRDQAVFSFDEDDDEHDKNDEKPAKRRFDASDDERDRDRAEERAISKPTIHLSSLPPGTSPAVIKALLASSSNLRVESVRILNAHAPSAQGSTARRSISAIVTLNAETPASDIDVTVNTLKQHYLGFGYYLSLSRHLSTSALGSGPSSILPLHSALASLPFGAKAAPHAPGPSLSRAPPPGPHKGGIAPPSSYAPNGGGRRAGPQVNVQPPTDLKQLRLVHKTLENLLAHGPEFEALLMSRPEVQRDEKWAWLWDARSAGGVWYRWRLWDLLSGRGVRDNKKAFGQKKLHRLFDGPSEALWSEPEEELPYEFATALDDIVNDPGYESSDEDMSEDEGAASKRKAGDSSNVDESAEYLNPLEKAKFTWLLSQLPTTTAKLRYGDVARITGFAIEHAGAGINEVVSVLVDNIIRPFCHGPTNAPAEETEKEDGLERSTDSPAKGLRESSEPDVPDAKGKKRQDMSSAQLIALHLISDILSASATSGVRHAWRYRALFESRLRRAHIFARLGRLERDLDWGRLRIEKWRRSVMGVLGLWEGWCVFEATAWERFRDEFEKPPLTAEEQEAVDRDEQEKKDREKGKSRWKKVEKEVSDAKVERLEGSTPIAPDRMPREEEQEEDLEGAPMEAEDEAEDLEGAPMDDAVDDLDGVAMDNEAPVQTQHAQPHEATTNGKADVAAARRKRPRAEDMFASDDE